MARAGRRNRDYGRRPASREPGACLRIISFRPSLDGLDEYLESLIRDTFGLRTSLIKIERANPLNYDRDLAALVRHVAEQKKANEEKHRRLNDELPEGLKGSASPPPKPATPYMPTYDRSLLGEMVVDAESDAYGSHYSHVVGANTSCAIEAHVFQGLKRP